MQADQLAIYQSLTKQWNFTLSKLQGMNGSAQLLPKDEHQVFRLDPASIENITKFDFGPILLRLPERGDNMNLNLFVACDGHLSFRQDCSKQAGNPVTDSFATRAGYFRYKNGQAHHVYGVHYDFALDEFGHPVFHSQFRDFPGFWAPLAAEFKLNGSVVNSVEEVLGTVRVPTAQMDMFSVLLQLFADHLLFKNSEKGVRSHFQNLLSKGPKLEGAGYQVDRLSTNEAIRCYRAPHWYPAS